jgi:hypothetical protein
MASTPVSVHLPELARGPDLRAHEFPDLQEIVVSGDDDLCPARPDKTEDHQIVSVAAGIRLNLFRLEDAGILAEQRQV